MTRITLDIRKTVEQNAEEYFLKAKKAKKKLEGAKEALFMQKKKLELLLKEKPKEEKIEIGKERKKKWYEKFRWFISSEGFLVVGGRDATSNEIVIKKHAEKNDIVFHTDMAGSPFVVVKVPGEKKPGKDTLQEASDFTAVHSKGWKQGMTTLAVFWVDPSQVTKEAQSGEFLPKGAFMVRGKTNYLSPTMNYAICIYDGAVMGGPISAVKNVSKDFVEIDQGNEKVSSIAKIIQKRIGGDLDEIIRCLPPGSKVKK
ncbi:DUF814 domain-containing protein [Candidatus Woesearchaeota archaeon]|nr:DUF814 domain-containing protein [Candidatus Woesearchaeota archaeon]